MSHQKLRCCCSQFPITIIGAITAQWAQYCHHLPHCFWANTSTLPPLPTSITIHRVNNSKIFLPASFKVHEEVWYRMSGTSISTTIQKKKHLQQMSLCEVYSLKTWDCHHFFDGYFGWCPHMHKSSGLPLPSGPTATNQVHWLVKNYILDEVELELILNDCLPIIQWGRAN